MKHDTAQRIALKWLNLISFMLQVFWRRLSKIKKLRFLIPNYHFYILLNINWLWKICKFNKKINYLSKKITKKIIIFELLFDFRIEFLLLEKYQRFDQRIFYIKNCKNNLEKHIFLWFCNIFVRSSQTVVSDIFQIWLF